MRFVPFLSVSYVKSGFHLTTVAWSFRLAGAASKALSTSACDAPGSSGGGGGGAPRPSRPCASALVEMAIAQRTRRRTRFIQTSNNCFWSVFYTSRPTEDSTVTRLPTVRCLFYCVEEVPRGDLLGSLEHIVLLALLQ